MKPEWAISSLSKNLVLFVNPEIVFKAAADSEHAAEWNRKSWQTIRFRPRVLRPIENVDLSTSILGNTYSAPFFICPAGGGKLAHPEGEVLMTKVAGKHNVLHWVCNMAGCTQQEIADARLPNQTLYWQIYAMNDLAVTEKEIKRAVVLGYKGFALTVDAIRAGKRERDVRASIEAENASNNFSYASNTADYCQEEESENEDESFASGPKVNPRA